MFYYVRVTSPRRRRSRHEPSPVGWWRDPWRKPRILVAITVVYLVGRCCRCSIAVLFSFNNGRSRTSWQGFSMRWYCGDPIRSVWHDASLHTAADAHPEARRARHHRSPCRSASLFAIGIDRWRGRLPAGRQLR